MNILQWNLCRVAFIIYMLFPVFFVAMMYGQEMPKYIVGENMIVMALFVTAVPAAMGYFLAASKPEEEDELAVESWRKKK